MKQPPGNQDKKKRCQSTAKFREETSKKQLHIATLQRPDRSPNHI